MAGTGTYSAYRQLKPLEGDISQDIQQQEENGARRRAEKRQEDQIAQQKIDKEAQRKQELWDKYVKPLSNYDTGSKSLNEAQGRLLQEAQKQYVPLMNILKKSDPDSEEFLNASFKLQNINKLPENLASMTKSLTERDLAIRKGVSEGTLFANPDYEKNFQEGYQNKLLALDENGMPMVAFKDLNGDGKNDLETYDEIQNVVPKYDIQPRFDRDKELLEASTKLQPVVTGTDNGVVTRTVTAVDPNLLKNYVANQLFEADGVAPTPKLKSFAREAGVAFDDAKGLKKLSDQFENDIKLRTKGGVVEKRNYSALDVQKEQRQAAKDARAERKENQKTAIEKTTTSFDSSLRKDDFTGKVLAKDAIRDKMISISGENLKFKNLGGMKSGLNDGYITGFALDNKNNIVVTGKALISKGQKYKKNSDGMSLEDSEDPTLDSYSTGSNYGNFRRVVKSTELNDLATRAGYSNAEGLREELKKLNSGSKSSNKIKIDY